ncbi:MAG: hypothetical protein HQL32_12165 [Planctomycetes bacterium]|nr:hypothetical protein [Planctomycetota bacterium]
MLLGDLIISKKKYFYQVSILIVSYYICYGDIVNSSVRVQNRWKEGVCLQSHVASCAPAACSTLLAAHGIDVTEKEMVQLCRTTQGGTKQLWALRALAQCGAQKGLDLYYNKLSLDDLRTLSKPVLVNMSLKDEDADIRYHRDWGWNEGEIHSVLVYGVTGDRLLVADPRIGRELWSVESLDFLWDGWAVYLK